MEIGKIQQEIQLPEIQQEEPLDEIIDIDSLSVVSNSNTNNITVNNKLGEGGEDELLKMIDKLFERGLSRAMKLTIIGGGLFVTGAGITFGGVSAI